MSAIQEFHSAVSGYAEFETVDIQNRGDKVEVVFSGAPDGLRNQIRGLAEGEYGLTVEEPQAGFWLVS